MGLKTAVTCSNVFQVEVEVVDTICDVKLYTECNMRMDVKPYESTEPRINQWAPITCVPEVVVEMHNKTKPVCRNETKWNCISDWVLKPNGEKVARKARCQNNGVHLLLNINIFIHLMSIVFVELYESFVIQVFEKVGDCTPMTWMNCTLEQIQVPFTTSKPNCTEGAPICWEDCSPIPDEREVDHFECTVEVCRASNMPKLTHIIISSMLSQIKYTAYINFLLLQHITTCESVPKLVSGTIKYEECWDEMIMEEMIKELKVPCQERLHRKQCLLSQEQGQDEPFDDSGKINIFFSI